MKKILTIPLLLLFLCGCYDNDEPNDIAYVTAIGIDKSEENEKNFDITIQFANPTSISGGSSEEGGNGKNIMTSITIEAPDIYSAVGLADNVISKNLNLSHMKLFVFSKEIASEGISGFLETITRSEEIRPNVYTAVSSGKAGDYLKKSQPLVEINPAKYYQLTFEKTEFGAVPESYGRNLYFYSSVPEKNAVIPLVGIAEASENSENNNQNPGEEENPENKNAELNTQGYEYNIKDYKGGQVGVYSEEKGEAAGCAVFKKDKMIGELGFIETNLYNMLTNNFSKNYATIKSDKSDKPITLLLGLNRRTKIKYDKKENKSYISLNLEGDFVSLPTDYLAEEDIEEFQKVCSAAIKQKMTEFINRTKNEFNSDIIGFGMAAKSKFLTSESFKLYDWEDKFTYMDFEIDLVVRIRRTGLTVRGKL